MRSCVYLVESDTGVHRLLAIPLAIAAIAASACLTGCGETAQLSIAAGTGPDPQLPPPTRSLIPTVNIAPAVGWPAGVTPRALSGAQVNAFATNLNHPRWLYVLPNGDVLVAETNAPKRPDDATGLRGWFMRRVMKRAGARPASADQITLLRDADGDGVAEFRYLFVGDLHSPFGMVLVGGWLYVADTDALLRFPYAGGATQTAPPGEKIVDLPAGEINHHWTKNVIASPDAHRLYVTVGSNSNVGENGLAAEDGRAAIWEIDPATGSHRIYAHGLRNPNGLAWEPTTGALWTVVNERDELGSDLVPDYLTSVRDGGFYGWPYCYFGSHVDGRVKPQDPALVATALVPDYALGPHTASLGLAFAPAGASLPSLHDGMFVGQHGSWNRRPLSGYRVIFIPFSNGRPAGEPIDILSGFINDKGEAYGRPVGVALDRRGALLVADDVGNVIWRVSAAAARQPTASHSEHIPE
ncbi:MAG: sorbosone dehydrogenase family protein [Pseudomonadales bacterium]|nr:sorbosone dehydrogenase family protein [Pseudomonadales bacterium]